MYILIDIQQVSVLTAIFLSINALLYSPSIRLGKIWHSSRAVTSSIAFISSCLNPVLYFFAGKSYIRREGLAFMARLFEGTGLDSVTRKSRQNSQNSRDKDKDKDVDVVMLNDKDLDSVTNSSSNMKPVKNDN